MVVKSSFMLKCIVVNIVKLVSLFFFVKLVF